MSTNASLFDGKLSQFVGYKILGFLITAFTVGICAPWAITMICRWEAKHTIVDGHRLAFDGTALQLFGQWIKWLLLSIITLGLFTFWAGIALREWKAKHTHFAM